MLGAAVALGTGTREKLFAFDCRGLQMIVPLLASMCAL